MGYNKFVNFIEPRDNLNNHASVSYELHGERMKSPEFSIMIPTYKRPELLSKAIKSALDQKTKVKYEVVVIDNYESTDRDTVKKILEKFNDARLCYYINSENIGMFGNWNRCISLAGSNWLLVLNDDDEIDEYYVDNIMGIIEKIPSCGAVSCDNVIIDENDNITSHGTISADKLKKIQLKDFYFRHPINIYGCAFNKKEAIKIGGFNEEMYPCSDVVFLINLCINSDIYLYTKKLFKYRWSDNESKNLSTQLDFIAFNYTKAKVLNSKYFFYSEKTDKFLRKLMADNMTNNLLRRKIENCDLNAIYYTRKELGEEHKYSVFNAYFYKVVKRIYNLF